MGSLDKGVQKNIPTPAIGGDINSYCVQDDLIIYFYQDGRTEISDFLSSSAGIPTQFFESSQYSSVSVTEIFCGKKSQIIRTLSMAVGGSSLVKTLWRTSLVNGALVGIPLSIDPLSVDMFRDFGEKEDDYFFLLFLDKIEKYSVINFPTIEKVYSTPLEQGKGLESDAISVHTSKTDLIQIFMKTDLSVYTLKDESTQSTYLRTWSRTGDCALYSIKQTPVSQLQAADTKVDYDEFISSEACQVGTYLAKLYRIKADGLPTQVGSTSLEFNSKYFDLVPAANGYVIAGFSKSAISPEVIYIKVASLMGNPDNIELEQNSQVAYTASSVRFISGRWINNKLYLLANKKISYTTPDTYNVYSITQTNCFSSDCALCTMSNTCGVCPLHVDPTSQSYFYRNRCFDTSFIPPGTAIVGDRLENCLTQGCEVCSKDVSICEKCLPNLYLNAHVGASPVCQDLATVSALQGYGPNNVDYKVYPCQDKACKVCSKDFTKCTACKSLTDVLLTTKSTCIANNPASFPTKVGLVLDTSNPQQVSPCKDTNCQDCKTDNASCSQCSTQWILMEFLVTPPPGEGSPIPKIRNLCTQATITQLPTGMRIFTDSGVTSYRFCQVAGCQTCFTDASSCEICNKDLFIGIKDSTVPNAKKVCASKTDLATWTMLGVKTGTITFESCTDNRCLKCVDDSTKCTECKSADPKIYVSKLTNKCMSSTDTPKPEGQGIPLANTNSLTLETCTDAQCKYCWIDNSKCEECKVDFYVNFASQCITKDMIVSGSGIKDGKFVVTCGADNCKNCLEDYSVCKECNSGYGLESGLCASPMSGYGLDTVTKILKPCYDTMCSDCKDNFLRCFACIQNDKARYLQPKFIKAGDVPLNPTPSQDYHINGCVDKGSVLPGFGFSHKTPAADPLPNEVLVPCGQADCAICVEDASICNECSKDHFRDISQTPFKCILQANIQPGTGIVKDTRDVNTCAVSSNCQDCNRDNNLICSSCVAGSDRYRFPDTGKCILKTEFPVSYGLQNGISNEKIVGKCSILNCKDCKDDGTTCAESTETYYLYKDQDPTKHQCVQENSISSFIMNGNFYGISKQEAKPTLTVCSSNCKACADDASICTSCISPYLLYKSTCVAATFTTDGYGKDALVSPTTLLPCSDSNCANCNDLFSKCVECKSGFYYTPSSPCLPLLQASNGFGKDLVTVPPTTLLKECVTTNCKDCYEDYKTCKECKDNQYILAVAQPTPSSPSSVCYPVDSIPLGNGVVTSSTIVKKAAVCAVALCKYCKSDNSKCDVCSDGLYVGIDGKSCVYQNLIPSGQGIVVPVSGAPTSLGVCSDANCQTCTADNTKCTACKSGFTVVDTHCEKCQQTGCSHCTTPTGDCTSCDLSHPFYTKSLASALTCLTSITPKLGKVIVGSTEGEVSQCSDANCDDCTDDYTSCKRCGTSFYLYRLIDQVSGTEKGRCAQSGQFPRGYGIDKSITAYSALSKCTDALCEVCSGDNQKCEKCNSETTTTKVLYQASGATVKSCTLLSNLPSGVGVDQTKTQAIPCRDLNCDSCINDYSICTKCKEGKRLYISPSDVTCIDKSTTTIIPDGYGIDPTQQTDVLKACADRACINCREDYRLCSQCVIEYLLYPPHMPDAQKDLASKCVLPADVAKGYTKTVGFQVLTTCGSGCADCELNPPGKCKVCVSGYYYSNRNGEIKCYGTDTVSFASEINLGLDNGDNTKMLLAPCSDPLCEKCVANSNICTHCKYKDANNKFIFLKDSTCIVDIPKHFGPPIDATQTTQSQTLASCQVSNCEFCSHVFSSCISCDNGYWLKKGENGSADTCILLTDAVSPGFGIALPVGSEYPSIKPCTLPNCNDCASDNTKCLSCQNNYYMIQTGATVDKCVSNTGLDTDYNFNNAQYGINPSSSTPLKLEACPQNCDICTSDSSKCMRCKMGFLYSPDVATAKSLPSVCVDATTQADGYGFLISVENGPSFVRCSDGNCKDCHTDSSTCQTCLPNYYLLPGVQSRCYSSLDGYGPIPTTQKLRACSAPLCKTCTTSFDICTSCEDTAQFFRAQDGSVRCFTPTATTFPGSFGKNTLATGVDALQLLTCDLSNCKSCGTDYKKCDSCSEGYAYHGNTNACTSITTKIPGFGLDFSVPASPKFTACKIPGCTECHDNAISSCTACQSNKYLKLPSPKDLSVSCISSIPDYYGPTSAGSMQLIPCKDLSCKVCSTSAQECTECSFPYTLEGTICNLPSGQELASGYGKNSNTNLIDKCKEPNCVDCRLNIEKCQRCDASYVLHRTEQKCYLRRDLDSIPAGKGPLGLELENCIDSNCDKCPQSAAICMTCKSSYTLSIFGDRMCVAGLPPIDMQAVEKIDKGKVKRVTYDSALKTTVVSFKDKLPDGVDYTNSVYFVPFDKDGGKTDSVRFMRIEVMPGGEDIKVKLDVVSAMDDVSALIKSKPSPVVEHNSRVLIQSENPFDTGVLLPKFSVYPSSNMERISKASIALTVIMAIVTFISFFCGRFYGFKQLYYHTLLASLIFPAILKPVYFKAFIVNFPYTLASFIYLPYAAQDSVQCSVKAEWLYSGLSCFLYDNVKNYLILLGLAILVKIIFEFIVRDRIKKEKLAFDKYKIYWIYKYLDISFFIKYFVAISPLWMVFAGLNLYHGAVSSLMAFGMLLSMLVLMLYAMIVMACIICTFYIHTAENRPSSNSAFETPLSFFSLLKSTFAKKLKSTSFIVRLTHFIEIWKNVIYCFVLVYLQNYPVEQSSVIFAVFGFNLIFLVAVRPYERFRDNLFIILLELTFTIIYILNLTIGIDYSSIGVEAFEQQWSVGYIILTCLIILLMILWLIILSIDSIKDKKNKVAAMEAERKNSIDGRRKSSQDNGEVGTYKKSGHGVLKDGKSGSRVNTPVNATRNEDGFNFSSNVNFEGENKLLDRSSDPMKKSEAKFTSDNHGHLPPIKPQNATIKKYNLHNDQPDKPENTQNPINRDITISNPENANLSEHTSKNSTETKPKRVKLSLLIDSPNQQASLYPIPRPQKQSSIQSKEDNSQKQNLLINHTPLNGRVVETQERDTQMEDNDRNRRVLQSIGGDGKPRGKRRDDDVEDMSEEAEMEKVNNALRDNYLI
jgi:hypothetical protein